MGSALRTEMVELKAGLNKETSDLRAELIEWMFLFWLGTVATRLGFGRFLLLS